ncbi:MAG TPA: putative toxin-antitoxin system toxin component, PIN family [Bryobacteraceae bacterium]|nr:putative toxin-antitoxin system toxin component, PIN family [Bryobacteraceae bacterium]
MIDTNVVISAVLKPDGLQRTVFLLAITKPATLYVSPEIMAEYRDVMSRPNLKIRKGARQQFLQLIKNRSRSITPVRSLQVANDPDDDIFLECADAARADYLVTGNTRHFPKFWKKTKVITAREFIGIVAPHLIS